MKKSELKQIIKEEIVKILSKNQIKEIEGDIEPTPSPDGDFNSNADAEADNADDNQKTSHFLKNSILQELNKIMFNLYDEGKIDEDEYQYIQSLLKQLDSK